MPSSMCFCADYMWKFILSASKCYKFPMLSNLILPHTVGQYQFFKSGSFPQSKLLFWMCSTFLPSLKILLQFWHRFLLLRENIKVMGTPQYSSTTSLKLTCWCFHSYWNDGVVPAVREGVNSTFSNILRVLSKFSFSILSFHWVGVL